MSITSADLDAIVTLVFFVCMIALTIYMGLRVLIADWVAMLRYRNKK